MRENEPPASGIGNETGIQEKSVMVVYPRSHAENRDDSKFCGNCGPPLEG
jgi:hypothetical protein